MDPERSEEPADDDPTPDPIVLGPPRMGSPFEPNRLGLILGPNRPKFRFRSGKREHDSHDASSMAEPPTDARQDTAETLSDVDEPGVRFDQAAVDTPDALADEIVADERPGGVVGGSLQIDWNDWIDELDTADGDDAPDDAGPGPAPGNANVEAAPAVEADAVGPAGLGDPVIHAHEGDAMVLADEIVDSDRLEVADKVAPVVPADEIEETDRLEVADEVAPVVLADPIEETDRLEVADEVAPVVLADQAEVSDVVAEGADARPADSVDEAAPTALNPADSVSVTEHLDWHPPYQLGVEIRNEAESEDTDEHQDGVLMVTGLDVAMADLAQDADEIDLTLVDATGAADPDPNLDGEPESPHTPVSEGTVNETVEETADEDDDEIVLDVAADRSLLLEHRSSPDEADGHQPQLLETETETETETDIETDIETDTEPAAAEVEPGMPSMDDLRAMAAELDEVDAILERLDEDPDGLSAQLESASPSESQRLDVAST